MFANSAQSLHIQRKQKIIYIAKTVIIIVSNRAALITTMIFAKKLIMQRL
jgi:hypothetical protein